MSDVSTITNYFPILNNMQLIFFKKVILFFSCQFVVRASGDYTLNLADPDLLVDWEQVELIVRKQMHIIFLS